MVWIYYTFFDKDLHKTILNEGLQHVPERQRLKILKMRLRRDAQLSVLGWLQLKYGLQQIGKEFNSEKILFNEFNKPYVGEGLYFNCSHSGEICICAISDAAEIGLDVELIRKIEISDFQEQCTAKEWERISYSSHVENAFFEYWTQKEAVLKAEGCGMIDSLKEFEIEDNHSLFKETEFFLKEIEVNPNYKCHLAFKKSLDIHINKPKLVESLTLLHKI